MIEVIFTRSMFTLCARNTTFASAAKLFIHHSPQLPAKTFCSAIQHLLPPTQQIRLSMIVLRRRKRVQARRTARITARPLSGESASDENAVDGEDSEACQAQRERKEEERGRKGRDGQPMGMSGLNGVVMKTERAWRLCEVRDRDGASVPLVFAGGLSSCSPSSPKCGRGRVSQTRPHCSWLGRLFLFAYVRSPSRCAVSIPFVTVSWIYGAHTLAPLISSTPWNARARGG